MKYIKITASSNLGNVLSVLVAGALLPFLPMLPLQLMVQNLLYDAAQLAPTSNCWSGSPLTGQADAGTSQPCC